MTEYTYDEDAGCIYKGKCKVKSYGASSNSEPFIGLSDLDRSQFDYIMENVKPNTEVQVILGAETNIVWQESMQFKSAYDNSNAWIKVSFPYNQSKVDIARDMVDNTYLLYILVGQIAEKEKKVRGKHGKYASELIQSSAMMHPVFWKIVGSEERYLDWLRGQKCMLTGGYVELESGERRCEAAHVRDIKYGAGIAKKPEYFAIPLHPEVHAEQHEKGVYSMWKKAGRPTPSAVQYPIHSQEDHIRQWLVISTLNYIRQWIQHEIKIYFNVDSMSHVSEEKFTQYLNDKAQPNQVEQILNLSRVKRDLTFLSGEK